MGVWDQLRQERCGRVARIRREIHDGCWEMFRVVKREGGRTHIRVVYTLNPDGSEDLLNPIFGPFYLLPVDGD